MLYNNIFSFFHYDSGLNSNFLLSSFAMLLLLLRSIKNTNTHTQTGWNEKALILWWSSMMMMMMMMMKTNEQPLCHYWICKNIFCFFCVGRSYFLFFFLSFFHSIWYMDDDGKRRKNLEFYNLVISMTINLTLSLYMLFRL